MAAAVRARDGVAALAAGRAASVSAVVLAPFGPLFVVDALDASYDILRSIPDRVVDELERAGVDTATVSAPARGGVLDELDRIRDAVVLRLFPEPHGADGVVPARWVDLACDWVLGELDAGERVRMRILSVEFDVGATDAAAAFHEARLARAWCDVVQGHPGDRIHTASLTFGRLPHVALAAGGPGAHAAGLLSRFDLLRDAARELAADVAYACIDIEPTFEGLALGLSPDGWRRQGGAAPNLVAGELVDECVPDAYPYQVLNPRHLERLGDVEEGELLEGGRVEYFVGTPADWLPSTGARYELQESGWELLAPCLVAEDAVAALVAVRAERAPSAAAPVAGSAPELDAVVLDGHPHPRRGTHLSILELASWLAREPHGDEPAAVSPVVATFLRWWASGLDDVSRQRLKEWAPALVGTSGDRRADRARSWVAVEWLVKVQAPTWLELAGMADTARDVRSLGSLHENLDLVRAVDLLGSAVTLASRRAELTAAIDDAGDDDTPAEQLAWEAWEQAAEVSGWAAASEAATHGAPSELTYATDLRVIESSRDARARDDNDAAGVSVGDSAWATALRAISDEAWDQAWAAADRAAKELAGIRVRDHIRRVVTSFGTRSTTGGAAAPTVEQAEQALDDSERWARESLADAALRGGAPTGGEHPWDAARQAARSSPRGSTWALVIDEARRAVGEDAWAQAMADARAATDAILRDASDLVGRSVAAAVAREAASASARTAAARAVAVARANGADDDAAAKAAVEALAPAVDALRDDAFSLLARLIDPRSTRSPGS